MENISLKLKSAKSLPGQYGITVGVVNSGNLEILLLDGANLDTDVDIVVFEVLTTVPGFNAIWNAVLTDFAAKYNLGGLKFILHDSGATPAVVSIRLRQAYEKYVSNEMPENLVYLELSARERILAITDKNSFREFLKPSIEYNSPHLGELDLPASFDDGVIIGRAQFMGQAVFIAAQNFAFMGGAVGEINGAKITGLCLKALKEKPRAVILLLDSGGVRLQEANAGEIAISEIISSIMALQHVGIPVYGIVAGRNGAFGGVGIIAECLTGLIITENARTGISGPEVIEAVMGTDEYDASDRALVWRTCGGRQRAILGDAIYSLKDLTSLKQSLGHLLDHNIQMSLEDENILLHQRLSLYGECHDGSDIWGEMGISNPDTVPDLTDAEFLTLLGGLK